MKKITLPGVARLAILTAAMVLTASCSLSGAQPRAEAGRTVLPAYPLLTLSDLNYRGAFALPAEEFGISSMNWAAGPLHVEKSSLFIAGHDHQDAVAEFEIPPLVNSVTVNDLNYAEYPRQEFAAVLDNRRVNNYEKLDQILGLHYHQGSLIINAVQNYDAPGDNRLSTVVVKDASDLQNSKIVGLHGIGGLARAAGWLSAVPVPWQRFIGSTHISGNSSGNPIISRLSVGPSAFAINLDAVAKANKAGFFRTREILGYSVDAPLHADLFNKSGKNDIWTHVSEARYGFIVPGTSTYMTIGRSGGHKSGVGYKVIQDNGNECQGYCANSAADLQNHYWLWSVVDMIQVILGKRAPSDIRPYESGKFNLPFQGEDGFKPIGGGSFDPQTGLLYLSILRANDSLGEYDNPPVIVAFEVTI